MAEQASGYEDASLRKKLVSILLGLSQKTILVLLIGALSMFFAEALSGSSVLWFLTSWAWLVTFWLYLAHTLLFINLALAFRRTSLTALYLWGVLFGLYESWITKVTWAGYIGSAEPVSQILGFAVMEFPMIVFFWHPVFSFILPVLSFEVLSGKNNVLPGHLPYLKRTIPGYLLAVIFIAIGAIFLSFNAKGNVVAVVLTIVGSLLIIGILYAAALGISALTGPRAPIDAMRWGTIGKIVLFITNLKSYGKPFSIESLRLGIFGMLILLAYLASLYGLGFVFLLPEKIAPPLTILLTLGIYALIVLLIYLKRPDGPAPDNIRAPWGFFSRIDLVAMGAILIVVAIPVSLIISLVPALSYVGVFISYVMVLIISPVLFLIAVGSVVLGRRKQKTKGLSPR